MDDERLSVDEINKLKVLDLKRELQSRGLSIIGNKSELKERLIQYCQSVDDTIDEDAVLNDVDLDDEKNTSDDILNDTHALNLEHLEHLDDKLVVNISTVNKPCEIMAPKKLILKRNMESVKDDDEEDVEIELPKTLETQSTNIVSVVNEDSNSNSEPITSNDVSEPKKIKLSLSALSEKERMELRIKKFGAISDDAKKKLRAERFGLIDNQKNGGTTVDVLKKRAERFGTVVSPALETAIEQEKLRKRKEKFALNEPVIASTNRTIKLN